MILQRLLESSWAPGSRLSIDGLARDLQVSPTPVREALVSLERSGLVDYAALKGYVVAPTLTREQIVDLIDARIVIETAVLSRAFQRWEEFVQALETAHASHAEVVERIYSGEDVDYALVREHFLYDWRFHQACFDYANNSYLTQAIGLLRPHSHRMRQAWADKHTHIDARQALSEHQEILAMVRQRNHDGAIDALTTHLVNVRKRSLEGVAAASDGADVSTPS